jgi:hypothetical protein
MVRRLIAMRRLVDTSNLAMGVKMANSDLRSSWNSRLYSFQFLLRLDGPAFDLTSYDVYYVKLIKEFTKVISIVLPNGSLSPQAHLKTL